MTAHTDSTSRSDLVVEHHTAADIPAMRDELLAVHADANADVLSNPFYSPERFWERMESYVRGPNFDLVAGRIDGDLVGYMFGATLPAETAWWSKLEDAEDPDELSRETGSRTFAVREFMVRKACQRRGYGRRLHDALLDGRPEERATLLVRSDNPARELYLRWGWSLVGFMQPFPDSPRFESLVLPLT